MLWDILFLIPEQFLENIYKHLDRTQQCLPEQSEWILRNLRLQPLPAVARVAIRIVRGIRLLPPRILLVQLGCRGCGIGGVRGRIGMLPGLIWRCDRSLVHIRIHHCINLRSGLIGALHGIVASLVEVLIILLPGCIRLLRLGSLECVVPCDVIVHSPLPLRWIRAGHHTTRLASPVLLVRRRNLGHRNG